MQMKKGSIRRGGLLEGSLISHLPENRNHLEDWGRSNPGRGRGACLRLEALGCLVPLSEVLVVTMEGICRGKLGWEKREGFFTLQLWEQGNTKDKGVSTPRACKPFENNSHDYLSLNSHCLVECLTHSRCAKNICWLKWLINCSLCIRIFFLQLG